MQQLSVNTRSFEKLTSIRRKRDIKKYTFPPPRRPLGSVIQENGSAGPPLFYDLRGPRGPFLPPEPAPSSTVTLIRFSENCHARNGPVMCANNVQKPHPIDMRSRTVASLQRNNIS